MKILLTFLTILMGMFMIGENDGQKVKFYFWSFIISLVLAFLLEVR